MQAPADLRFGPGAVRPEVPVDWLLAVREVGVAEANRIEEIRLLLEHVLGREVDYADAVDYDRRQRS